MKPRLCLAVKAALDVPAQTLRQVHYDYYNCTVIYGFSGFHIEQPASASFEGEDYSFAVIIYAVVVDSASFVVFQLFNSDVKRRK